MPVSVTRLRVRVGANPLRLPARGRVLSPASEANGCPALPLRSLGSSPRGLDSLEPVTKNEAKSIKSNPPPDPAPKQGFSLPALLPFWVCAGRRVGGRVYPVEADFTSFACARGKGWAPAGFAGDRRSDRTRPRAPRAPLPERAMGPPIHGELETRPPPRGPV